MSVTLKLRQGLVAALPTTGLTVGEPLFATDSQEIYVAASPAATIAPSFNIATYSPLGAVDNLDLIAMHDVSAGALKARKITFGDFKAALNIPATSTDEKVAAASGATAGYLGTNGNDGILRAGNGLSMIAGGANAFVTLALAFAAQAQGDIIYRGASAWANLAVGVAGSILQAGGVGTNPTWIKVIDGGTF